MEFNVVLTHKLFFSKKNPNSNNTGGRKKNPTFLAQSSSTPFTFPNITRWCIGQIQEVSKKGFLKKCAKRERGIDVCEGRPCLSEEHICILRTRSAKKSISNDVNDPYSSLPHSHVTHIIILFNSHAGSIMIFFWPPTSGISSQKDEYGKRSVGFVAIDRSQTPTEFPKKGSGQTLLHMFTRKPCREPYNQEQTNFFQRREGEWVC